MLDSNKVLSTCSLISQETIITLCSKLEACRRSVPFEDSDADLSSAAVVVVFFVAAADASSSTNDAALLFFARGALTVGALMPAKHGTTLRFVFFDAGDLTGTFAVVQSPFDSHIASRQRDGFAFDVREPLSVLGDRSCRDYLQSDSRPALEADTSVFVPMTTVTTVSLLDVAVQKISAASLASATLTSSFAVIVTTSVPATSRLPRHRCSLARTLVRRPARSDTPSPTTNPQTPWPSSLLVASSMHLYWRSFHSSSPQLLLSTRLCRCFRFALPHRSTWSSLHTLTRPARRSRHSALVTSWTRRPTETRLHSKSIRVRRNWWLLRTRRVVSPSFSSNPTPRSPYAAVTRLLLPKKSTLCRRLLRIEFCCRRRLRYLPPRPHRHRRCHRDLRYPLLRVLSRSHQ